MGAGRMASCIGNRGEFPCVRCSRLSRSSRPTAAVGLLRWSRGGVRGIGRRKRRDVLSARPGGRTVMATAASAAEPAKSIAWVTTTSGAPCIPPMSSTGCRPEALLGPIDPSEPRERYRVTELQVFPPLPYSPARMAPASAPATAPAAPASDGAHSRSSQLREPDSDRSGARRHPSFANHRGSPGVVGRAPSINAQASGLHRSATVFQNDGLGRSD